MLDRYLIVIDQTTETELAQVTVVPVVINAADDDDAEAIAAAIVHVLEIDADVEITNLDEGIRAAMADEDEPAAPMCPTGCGKALVKLEGGVPSYQCDSCRQLWPATFFKKGGDS